MSRSAGLLVSSSLARGGGLLASSGSSLSLLSGLFGSLGSNGPPLMSGGMSDGSKIVRSRQALARPFEVPVVVVLPRVSAAPRSEEWLPPALCSEEWLPPALCSEAQRSVVCRRWVRLGPMTVN